jgi:hypothetical protein
MIEELPERELSRRCRPDAATVLGLVLVLAAGVVYWLSARDFDSTRQDFFYLADAFLHGRTWLEFAPGPYDVIVGDGGRIFVPFAPFPALVFAPLVAVLGPETVDRFESGINAALAAGAVGLCWMLVGRVGPGALAHRVWIVLLFAFSTPLWWVTARGGVWHSGQLIATVLTLACLVELWGRQRPWLVGLLAGAAFLTRAPLAFAIPFYLLLLEPHRPHEAVATAGGYVRSSFARWPVREWVTLGVATLPALALFFWYNAARFRDPLESGYGLALLPDWLAALRAQGLFSLAHVPMNLDFFLLHVPALIPSFPWFRPDGLGMSVFLTSPALLLAARAPWHSPRAWWLLGATIAVLLPTLLYYGGGWLQYGYRYFLDSIPFVIALIAMAGRRHGIGWGGAVLILFGVLVNLGGAYWVTRL